MGDKVTENTIVSLAMRQTAASPIPGAKATTPFSLNLKLETSPAVPAGSSFTQITDPGRRLTDRGESRWKQGTYLILGGGSLLAGSLMLNGSKGRTFRRGFGLGLAITGGVSLTFDLLDKLEGPKTMPRWLKNTVAIGLGILVGSAHGYMGTFDTSGPFDNNGRNGVDEFGP